MTRRIQLRVPSRLGWRRTVAMLLFAAASGPVRAAQTAPADPAVPVQPAAAAGRHLVPLDRVVAIVNGGLVLQSEVAADERLAAFQPLRVREAASQDQVVERLIDRELILQQMSLQPQPPIDDAEVDAQLAALRKSIPACAAYRCDTDAGWERFVAAQGFTMDELRRRWKQRMEVLRFIEQRFRMGIRITPAEIDTYYRQTLVPAYRTEKAAPPTEESISDRIQEILLQQQVTELLNDWLKTLRTQGSVRVFPAGEVLP